jgi:hypothetical protein
MFRVLLKRECTHCNIRLYYEHVINVRTFLVYFSENGIRLIMLMSVDLAMLRTKARHTDRRKARV